MGKLLITFYLFVGIFCTVSIFTSFAAGQFVLSQWLFLSAIINFTIFYLIWKNEKKQSEDKKPNLVRVQ